MSFKTASKILSSTNKRYFSYARVSTQKQGEAGTSLTEQKTAIKQYAKNKNFKIIKHFEERKTAAKLGRPVFLKMLEKINKGCADGLILHKIDRGARNLKDWVALGNLMDAGAEIHFVNENIDLASRGGRLSADIQAVVASDYIRNLREETKKGIYGRLKQGLYPFPAVLGYLDGGKGKPKKPNPLTAPLIKHAFNLYSTGDWGLIPLADELYKLGLTNKKGNKLSINTLSNLLKNPFYMGIIRIEKTGEYFTGVHAPIIKKKLFDEVQNVFKGKSIRKTKKHSFLFRQHIYCLNCQKILTGERQKNNV